MGVVSCPDRRFRVLCGVLRLILVLSFIAFSGLLSAVFSFLFNIEVRQNWGNVIFGHPLQDLPCPFACFIGLSLAEESGTWREMGRRIQEVHTSTNTGCLHGCHG